MATSLELLTAWVISSSKYFCKPKLKIKRENIATIKDGISVNKENKETYLKFVCETDLFF